jgi:hypothetical protein
VGIIGEVTSPKITQKRKKNEHYQYPNTPISFKKGVNAEKKKEMTFSLPQN